MTTALAPCFKLPLRADVTQICNFCVYTKDHHHRPIFYAELSEIVKFHKDSSQSNRRQSFLREKYGMGVRSTMFLVFRSWGRLKEICEQQKKKQKQPEGGLINQPIRVRDISAVIINKGTINCLVLSKLSILRFSFTGIPTGKLSTVTTNKLLFLKHEETGLPGTTFSVLLHEINAVLFPVKPCYPR